MGRISLTYSMIIAFSKFIAFIRQTSPFVLACASNPQGCSTSKMEELASTAQGLQFTLRSVGALGPYSYNAIADWMGRITLRVLPLAGFALQTSTSQWGSQITEFTTVLASALVERFSRLACVAIGVVLYMDASLTWYRVCEHPKGEVPLLDVLSDAEGEAETALMQALGRAAGAPLVNADCIV
ncbi:hypothetical protein BKA93DRAFT_829250 [Sparassis latifolia]